MRITTTMMNLMMMLMLMMTMKKMIMNEFRMQLPFYERVLIDRTSKIMMTRTTIMIMMMVGGDYFDSLTILVLIK